MLDATLKSQLTAYLQNLREPISLVATLGDGASAWYGAVLRGEFSLLLALGLRGGGRRRAQECRRLGRQGAASPASPA